MGLITIELIDDFRSECGSIYNSYIEEEVFYDVYGFPYLPAWMIKNSLQRLAEKMLNQYEQEQIFGSNDKKGVLMMEDALIGYRESMKYAVINSGDGRIQNPKVVLQKFINTKTYLKDGKEQSFRVLNKGLIFEQCLRLPEQYRASFQKLVDSLNTIIYGSGRIHCEVDWDVNEGFVYGLGRKNTKDLPDFEETEELCRMEYSLKLLSPVCVSDPLDVTYSSKDFIPGRLIYDSLHMDRIAKIRNVKASFAFCDIDGQRGQASSASFSVLKTDKKQLRDRLSFDRKPDDFEQMKRLSGLYIDDVGAKYIKARSVDMQYIKIIKLNSEEEKVYSCHVITSEQVFRGFFEGTREDLAEMRRSIETDPYLKIGAFQEEGLGLCRIEIENIKNQKQIENIQSVKEIRIQVNSPAALRLENGLYTDSAEAFLNEMKRLLELDDLEISNNCKETETIQGYSSEWLKHKPVMYLTKAGSVFRLRRKSGKDITFSKEIAFLGDFNADGFGEIRITPMEDCYYRSIGKSRFDRYSQEIAKPYSLVPGKMFVRQLQTDWICHASHLLGRNDGKEFYEKLYENAKTLIQNYLGYETEEEVVLENYLKGIREITEYMIFENKNKS